MGDDPELDNASESRGKLWDSACRGNNHYSLHHPGAGIQWIMRNKNESFYLNCSRNQASSDVFVSDKKISYRRHHLYLHDSDQETHWQSWVMNKQLTEAGIKRLMIVFFSNLKDFVVNMILLIGFQLLYFAFATQRLQTRAKKINLIFHTLHVIQD